MRGWKNGIGLVVTLGLLVYAIPHLTVGDAPLQGVFTLAWIAFALLVTSAHLYQLLRVDEQTHQELAKIRKMKYVRLQQMLQKRSRQL